MEFKLVRTMWQENEDFELFRENIGNEYIFIHVLTSAKTLIDGKLVKIHPGGCVFYEMNKPQYLKADGVKLVHDWFHADPSCGKLMERYGLCASKIYYPRSGSEITRLIDEIELEQLKMEKYSDRAIAAIAEKLFITVSRAESSNKIMPLYSARKEEFINARAQIHSELSHQWKIDEMARIVNMSSSRFYVLYKEFFGITPQNDLINKRIQTARILLGNGGCTIEQAAAQTGYTNIYHFIRQFKKIIGQTPGEFRKISENPLSAITSDDIGTN